MNTSPYVIPFSVTLRKKLRKDEEPRSPTNKQEKEAYIHNYRDYHCKCPITIGLNQTPPVRNTNQAVMTIITAWFVLRSGGDSITAESYYQLAVMSFLSYFSLYLSLSISFPLS
jgi:hypothetical protein